MFRSFLKGPALAREQYVVNFRDPALGIKNLLVRCDQDLGGFSTAELTVVNTESQPKVVAELKAGQSQPDPGELKDAPTLPEVGEQKNATSGSDAVNVEVKNAPTDPTVYGSFHGDLSLDLPEDRPEVVRLGYAMFRTKDRRPGLFGLGASEFLDWSHFGQLCLRVRGDHRKYFVNIQAETPYPTDLYQHRLFLKNTGDWEVVTIPLTNFILTNGGVIQEQFQMEKDHIKSVGIGLIDGQYGPYRLDIDWVKVIAGHYNQGLPEQADRPDLKPGERLPMN